VSRQVLLLAALTIGCRSSPASGARAGSAELWAVETGADPSTTTGPEVAANGTIYVGGSVDASTGEPAWPDGSVRRPCLLAFDADGRLRTKVPGTPPTGWTTLAPPMSLALAPWGTAYAIDANGGLYGILPTGETIFRQLADDTRISGPIALGSGGRIFVGGPGGLRGLDLQATENPVGFLADLGRSHASSPVAGLDGRVYFRTSFGGRLIALERDGTSAWVRLAPSGALAVDPEGNLMVATSEGLLSYRAADGEPRWTFLTASPPGPPVVGADGTAYVITRTGLVHAIDSLGRARWSFALDGPALSAPTLGPDGTLYLTTSTGPNATLYALDAQGAKRLTRPLPLGPGRPAAGADGRLYCVGGDRRLHAFAAP